MEIINQIIGMIERLEKKIDKLLDIHQQTNVVQPQQSLGNAPQEPAEETTPSTSSPETQEG